MTGSLDTLSWKDISLQSLDSLLNSREGRKSVTKLKCPDADAVVDLLDKVSLSNTNIHRTNLLDLVKVVGPISLQ